jgi:hypothetical protein
MRARAGHTAAVVVTVALSASAGVWLDRGGPAPSADTARGSEDAFATGLHHRELPPGAGPRRWTRLRARLRFERLPLGPARLEVRLAGHQAPVSVVAGGVRLGLLAPSQVEADFVLPALRNRHLEVELRTEGFAAGDGRQLGALLGRVTLRPSGRGSGGAVPLLVVLPAAAFALAALAFGPLWALAAGQVGALTALWLLWPCGVARSPWAAVLCGLLVLGAILSGGFAMWSERRQAGSGRWALAALLAAWLVQAVLATCPMMVASDVVFHAHKLHQVAHGQLFPTSVTQHARPFQIPYPALFYALLAPLRQLGVDDVALVRWGAGVSGVVAGAGLLVGLGGAEPALAGLAVLLLQLQPVTFDVHSYGNLSNVFAQSWTVLLFAWWISARRPGWAGAALAAAAALSHMSGCAVICAWGASLLAVTPRGERRVVLSTVGLGVGISLLYYAAYAPMMLEQLPRLLEGGGQGRGVSQGAWDALHLQVLGALGQWGVPVLALAVVGAPRFRDDRLDRALLAAFAAGAALALLAVVSPVEVRHLYFLGLPVAVCAARGAVRLARRGRSGLVIVILLVAAQAGLAVTGIEEAVFHRFRL